MSQALCTPGRIVALRGLPWTLGVVATHAGALNPGVLPCAAWETKLTCACIPSPLTTVFINKLSPMADCKLASSTQGIHEDGTW